MKLTMLGTGHAAVTECYNTCFVLEDEAAAPENKKRYLMVDGGGGNGLLRQLKHAGLNWMDMKDIFVTHKHLDHIMGIFWVVRLCCQLMAHGKYEGEVNIYGHEDVIRSIRTMAETLLLPSETRYIDDRLHLIAVSDGETRDVNGFKMTFFDIESTKEKQFGFSLRLKDGRRLVCCGDEPCHPCEEKYAEGCDWLLHEAFCLYSEADIFKPYEKHHSTVKDACELAERLAAKNLLLYHTEDKNIASRKQLYTAEGQQYYSGRLYVPDDLESIEI